jgi:hypothetical protein
MPSIGYRPGQHRRCDVGTWGSGTFDNDQAVDWTYGLEGKTDLSFVEVTIDRVLSVAMATLKPITPKRPSRPSKPSRGFKVISG